MFLPKRIVVSDVNPSKIPSGKLLSWLLYRLRFPSAVSPSKMPSGSDTS